MIVHPGDQLSWNDSTYQVCEVNEGYVVLRDTVTDVEREVASSVLEKTAIVPEIRRLTSLSDLRILKSLGKADRLSTRHVTVTGIPASASSVTSG